MSKDSKKRILTIPNMISTLRIFLIIPFVIFFLRDNYIASAMVLLVSGVSDMFDGMLARKLNQISDLGLILDPFADKLTLGTAMICISIKIPELFPATVILIIKESIMLLGGFYMIRRNMAIPPSKWYGKLATVIFYVSGFVLMYLKAFHGYQNFTLTLILIGITTVVMVVALVLYIRLFFCITAKKSNQQ